MLPPEETSALTRILRGIEKDNLCATTKGVTAIARGAANYASTAGTLARSISSSPALTTQVLKVVNGSLTAGEDPVVDISRAVLLMGYDSVRALALSLGLLEQVQDMAHQKILSGEMARSLAGSSFARELAKLGRYDAERAAVQATVASLGQVLVATHAPEAVAPIRKLAQRDGITESEAARKFLGRSLAELAVLGATQWNVGDELQVFLDQSPQAQDGAASAASAGVDIAEALYATRSLSSPRVQLITKAYAERHRITEPRVAAALETAFTQFASTAKNLGLPSTLGSALRDGSELAESAALQILGRDFRVEPFLEKDPIGRPLNHRAALGSAVLELSERAANAEDINSLMRFGLDALVETAGFQRAILFIRAADGRGWKPSMVVGADATEVKKNLHMRGTDKLNLLTAALEREVCLTIGNAHDEVVQRALPVWFSQHLPNVGSFLLMPFVIKGRSVGGVYVDRPFEDSLTTPEDLQLLVAVRNNLVLALRAL